MNSLDNCTAELRVLARKCRRQTHQRRGLLLERTLWFIRSELGLGLGLGLRLSIIVLLGSLSVKTFAWAQRRAR